MGPTCMLVAAGVRGTALHGCDKIGAAYDHLAGVAKYLTFVQVAAGEYLAALLRSDGPVGACGHPREDLTCVKVAVGGRRTALPRSGGAAVACCRLAALVEDLASSTGSSGI